MIVVTGGSGHLGSAIVAKAQATGINIAAPTRGELNITNYARCLAYLGGLTRNDVVIHCAAETNLDECDSDPIKCFAVNAVGSLNIARAVERVGCFLIYISTDYVYDGAKRSLEHAEVDDPANPCTVYGVSKLAAENFVILSGARHLIVRLGWLFGTDPTIDKKFVGIMLRKAFSHDIVKVVDDKIGTFTYAPHAAEMILRYADIKQQGIRHLTNQGLVSRHVFTEHLFKLWGIQVTLISCPSSDFPDLVRRPDFSGLRTIYTDAQMPTWQEALKEFKATYG